MQINLINIIALSLIILIGLILFKPKMGTVECLDTPDEAIANLASIYNENDMTTTNLITSKDATVGNNLSVNNDIFLGDGKTFRGKGRMHVHGPELLYLLNKNGVVIGKEWKGNGNLSVQGNITGPTISAINKRISDVRNELLRNIQGKRPGCNWNGCRGIWGDHGKEDDYNMCCSGGKITGIYAHHP